MIRRTATLTLLLIPILSTVSDSASGRMVGCASLSAPSQCFFGCYPEPLFEPPSEIRIHAAVISGSASEGQMFDFVQRLQTAADGWGGFFGPSTNVNIVIDEFPTMGTTYYIDITDQIAEGQAFTRQPPSGGSGTMTVPLEWLKDPQFPGSYVSTVLAHEIGHFLGLGQNVCGSSIMGDTTLQSHTWFTDCDYAFSQWWYEYGAPSCHLLPPCGQDEFLGEDGCCYQQNGSPILLSLSAGPIRLSAPRYGVDFDIYGTGTPFRVAWPLDPSNNAWLALDRDGDGRITSGRELFGDATLLADGTTRAPNGFVALAQYDANADWRIDTRDAVFGQLRIWTDMDRNGVGASGELHPLPDFGIESIDLSYRESGRTDSSGNQFRYRSQVGASIPPIVRFAYDVYLAVRPIQ
jgi:hypothetical protein